VSFEDLLHEPKLEHKALQEEPTSWNSHKVIIGAHTGINEVLPEETKVPYN